MNKIYLLDDIYRLVQHNESGYYIYDPKTKIGNVIDKNFKFQLNDVWNIYPGSFNPLHERHKEIYNNITGTKFYEISIYRQNKFDLTLSELNTIVNQFTDPILITRWSRFVEKVCVLRQYFPYKLTYHIGYDTYHRLIKDIGYYGVGSINANFHIYDRFDDDTQLIYSASNDIIPNNCIARTEFSPYLSLSSTKVRNG